MTLRITLFGQLQVTSSAGSPAGGMRPRAQRLLAYLLLHRHRPLPRTHLAFTLWPDHVEAAALATLRRALSDLRTGLPPLDQGDWLLVTGATVRWNPDAPCWLDIDEFERLIGQATPAALHRAVTLYVGDLLTGWVDDWLWNARDRLRGLQLSALGQLVAHHRALGAYAPALALARQALILDPLAEPVHRELIALHYSAGDRVAALATYDRLRALLHEELGVEPMAATQALRAAILRGETLPAATPPLGIGTTAPVAGPRLIGREVELANVSAQWERAAAGQGRVVIVGGEAGVGKSRLVHGLADEVTRRGGLTLVGYCYEFERALPYQAIVDLLRVAAPVLQHADLLPIHRAVLARLAPEVLGVLGGPDEERPTPADAREYLFEALLHAFLALARLQPLLLVVEDAHWAAESTLDWLTYCTPRLGAGRVLLVVTYRAHEVGAAHALKRLGERFGRDDHVSSLSLAPLSPAAHRELVGHLSGLDDATCAPVADRLFAETAGNPFFLQELIRGLIEIGQLVVDEGRWCGPFIANAATAVVPPPESVRAAIAARLERLPVLTRQFLQAAAVAGRVFPFELVQLAGGWAAEPALAALEEILARGFVREQPAAAGFAFAHHLVQEAIYAGLPGPRRRDWHRRVGAALETLVPDDPEALAYHYSQAGDAARASQYALQAGDRAWRLAAPHEAAAHYRAALDGWPATDPAGRAATLFKLGECLWITGALPDAMTALDDSRALFEALDDRDGAGAAERLIGRICWELGQREQAVHHYHRALAILERGPTSAELARAISAIAQMHMLASRYDEAITWGERALALAERLGAADAAVHALNNLGVAYAATGDPERGLTLLRTSLDQALSLGLHRDATRAYFNLAEQLAPLDRPREARSTYEALLAFIERTHIVKDGGALVSLVHLEWLAGEWSSALVHRQQFLDWARDSPTTCFHHVWASTCFGLIYNDLGEAATARQLLERELAAARGAGEVQTAVPHLGQLARAYALLSLESDARQILQEMFVWVDDSPFLHLNCTLPLLWACRWLAGHGAAQACLARLERAAAQLGNAEAVAALAEGRGVVLLVEGMAGPAAEQLQLAAARWAALERPYDQMRALADLGRAKLATGADTDARAAFDEALDLCHGLAAQLAATELRRSFLASSLVRGLYSARAVLAVRA